MNKGQVRNLAANVRHDKIETHHFHNLVAWAKKEINKPDFDIMSYISTK
jgi:L-rhamnose isomerase